MWKGDLVRRLGEAGCGEKDGRVGMMDMLARAGLPVPAGVVLTSQAHRVFLETSGALRELLNGPVGTGGGDRRAGAARVLRAPLFPEGELNREICEALIWLRADAVVVLSEDSRKGGLGSIPEVRDAIREAWLSPKGLERQLGAAARGEDVPTWPVLVQRQMHPRHTGWSATGAGKAASDPPAGGRSERVADLTARAAAVLGEPVRVRWGLQGGRWYVLSATRQRR